MKQPEQENYDKKEIAKDLLKLGAIQFNVQHPFTWVSGISSPVYCDNRIVNSNVEVRTKVVNAFVNLITNTFPNVELIAGVATGGIPMGVLIADRLKLPFIYVRQAPKEHGLMKQVEGQFSPGSKTVVIEDHISTGGSSFNAIQGLRKENLDLLALISLMTYRFEAATNLFTQENINYYSLCDLDAVIEVALTEGSTTDDDKEAILEFRKFPETWAASR